MSYNRSLAYFTDAVDEELGVLSQFLGEAYVERALNEAQRRAVPRLLLEKREYVNVGRGSDEYDLPADLHEITRFVPDQGTCDLEPYQRHGARLIFDCPTTTAFAGRLLYRAYYPDITNTQQCELPQAALDALISFALAKCIRKVANDRADYRKFSTLTGNNVSMADLEDAAFQHMKEYDAAIEDCVQLAPPTRFYAE